MFTGAKMIGLIGLHPVARRREPQAFHSGGGLSVEKVQHLDPVDVQRWDGLDGE